MQKRKLKQFLNLYPLLIDYIKAKQTEVKIQLYGRNKKLNIPIWLFKIESILQKITEAEEDVVVKEIIERVYRQGIDDKCVWTELPITESSYYRLKRKIEEKIYELYIASGDVTQDEILEDKIIN